MAKNRYINTKFWSDGWVSELDPVEKLLFIYLLTNEHTKICGIYELPLKIMAFETGLDKEILIKMIDRFVGKVYFIDGWIYIKNFIKHQAVNESIQKGIQLAYQEVPKDILNKIREIGESIDVNYFKKIDVVPDGLRKKILNRDHFTCQECKIKFEPNYLEIDHIVSREKGGTHEDSNLQVLCIKCHRIKHSTTACHSLSQDATNLNPNLNPNLNLNSNSNTNSSGLTTATGKTYKGMERADFKVILPIKDNSNVKTRHQAMALDALEVLSCAKDERSGVFGCYKNDTDRAILALDECKRSKVLTAKYFFKLWNKYKGNKMKNETH